jgi:glycosyltransferase involved in cell wall biosynthesis
LRILLISNFYPPHAIGGYEQWCQEVAERLSARGHAIVVVTSRHGGLDGSGDRRLQVRRSLFLEMDLDSWRNPVVFFTQRKRREHSNLAALTKQVAQFAPDTIMVWGMWNLPRSLASLAERLCPGRTVYYFGDYWPTLPDPWIDYWQAPAQGRLSCPAKRLLKSWAERLLDSATHPTPSFPHGLFPSEFLCRAYQQARIEVSQTRVILGGVETSPFYRAASRRVASRPGDPIRLLVASRLVADKGIHTAIEALANLTRERKSQDFRLTIAGTGEESYVSYLRSLARDLAVQQRIDFIGAVPPQEMPALYGRHDVFVFPSIWEEPFGRVLVEAMSSGLAVVGTTVGGAGEILQDEKTGLAFPPENAKALAIQIDRLCENSSLRERLAKQGQTFAIGAFDMRRMAEEIEEYLEEVTQCRSKA